MSADVFSVEFRCLNKNEKGGHTGRPISNVEGTLALLLVFGRFVCWRCRRRLCRRRRCLRSARHPVLEAADAFAKSLHDFRDPLTSEENQDNSQNHKPMKNTKFTHEPPPRTRRGGRRAIVTLAQVALRGKSVSLLAPTG